MNDLIWYLTDTVWWGNRTSAIETGYSNGMGGYYGDGLGYGFSDGDVYGNSTGVAMEGGFVYDNGSDDGSGGIYSGE